MNGKIIGAVVAVLVVVVAAVAVVAAINPDQSQGESKIIYDGNGGSIDDITSYVELSDVVSSNKFSYKDHAFRAWNTSADGSGTTYKVGDVVSRSGHGDVTLYAIWGYSFSITYYNESGTSIPEIQMMLVGSDVPITLSKFGSYALPDTGAAAVLFMVSGFDWVYDESSGRFIGTSGGSTVAVGITLGGAENVECKADSSTGGSITFGFSGPVTCKISVSYKA